MESDWKDVEILNIQSSTIHKKEYLGKRNLKKVLIPPFVKVIEAWGFAYCKGLECIWIPKTLSFMEENVFEGCEKLKEIVVYEAEETEPSFHMKDSIYENIHCYRTEANLLAYGILNFPESLDKKYLFEVSFLGSVEWYQRYDGLFINYLNENDESGFQPFLAGGEEDYEDPTNNIEEFCMQKQQKKVEGIIYRLSLDMEVRDKEVFTSYIEDHLDAVIRVFLQMREQSIWAIKVFTANNLLNANNIDAFLSAFEGELFTETRGYLLSVKDRVSNKDDVLWKQFEI